MAAPAPAPGAPPDAAAAPAAPDANNDLINIVNLPAEEPIEPEDFFKDLKQYFTTKLDEVQASSEKASADISSTLTKDIQMIHADLSNAIAHLQGSLESDMMDMRYLTQAPDSNILYLANKCERREFQPRVGDLHQRMLATQFGFDGDEVVRIDCQGVSVWDLIQDEDLEVNYFIVNCCLFHHYQIENLPHVSILSRTRLLVEEGDRDYLMFIYLLKRGL